MRIRRLRGVRPRVLSTGIGLGLGSLDHVGRSHASGRLELLFNGAAIIRSR
jgi:hypothetical protein